MKISDTFNIEDAKYSHEHSVVEFTLHVKVTEWLESWAYGYVEMGNYHLRIERLSPIQPADAAAVLAVIARCEQWLIQNITEKAIY